MSSIIIALLFAIGGAGWIYSYFMRTTGSNTKDSFVAAGVSGLLIFVMFAIVLSFVFGLLKNK